MRITFFTLLSIGVLLLTNCSENNNSENETTEALNEIEELHFTGKLDSFGDFFISKLLNSENLKTALIINGSGREELNLNSEYSEFTLPNNDLFIEISEWDISVLDYFSNDTPLYPATKLKSWVAVSGNIKLKVSNIEQVPFETYYDITIELKDIVFENNEKEQKYISSLIIENAGLGWFPG